jgi:hypothetical protein
MSGALHSLLARAPQIFDCLVDVIAVAIMMRQLSQMIVELVGEERLQYFSRTFVELLASLN